MKKIKEAFIAYAKRTAVGKISGVFKHQRPDDLLSVVLQDMQQTLNQVDFKAIDDVVIGCAMPEGEQGMNVARLSALISNLPYSVPAMTINRFCASGLQAIALAAQKIQLGQAEAVIAGGVESMSHVPMGGFQYSPNLAWFQHQKDYGIAYGMGLTAERVAKQYSIDRYAQDAFAVVSHQKAVLAMQDNAFQNEIVPITCQHQTANERNQEIQTNTYIVAQDEGPRKNCTIEMISRFQPVFQSDGTITAANASQMSDGASVLLIVDESFLHRYDLIPLGRWVGYAVVGVKPEEMGVGPVQAVPKVLQQTGLSLSNIHWIELNEAFAAQALAVVKALDLDPNLVNPYGGAIAQGHPLGATGAIRSTTLLHGLRREKKQYGMVTMCVGTGMGAAGIFESV